MKNIGYCKYPFGLVLKLFEILEKAVGRIPREMVSFEESRVAFLFFLNICPFLGLEMCRRGGFILLQRVAGFVRCIDLS